MDQRLRAAKTVDVHRLRIMTTQVKQSRQGVLRRSRRPASRHGGSAPGRTVSVIRVRGACRPPFRIGRFRFIAIVGSRLSICKRNGRWPAGIARKRRLQLRGRSITCAARPEMMTIASTAETFLPMSGKRVSERLSITDARDLLDWLEGGHIHGEVIGIETDGTLRVSWSVVGDCKGLVGASCGGIASGASSD